MPMNFPDEALKMTAQVFKFREQKEDESFDDFRLALHKHVKPIDHIESFEIKFKVGWDQWTLDQKHESLGLVSSSSDNLPPRYVRNKWMI